MVFRQTLLTYVEVLDRVTLRLSLYLFTICTYQEMVDCSGSMSHVKQNWIGADAKPKLSPLFAWNGQRIFFLSVCQFSPVYRPKPKLTAAVRIEVITIQKLIIHMCSLGPFLSKYNL